jgi:Flp pilus assembly protein TadD
MNDPGEVARLLENGRRLILGGQVPLAIKAFERAMAVAPENPRVLMALGSAWLANGESAKAAACFRALLPLVATDPAILFEFCRPLAAAGEPTTALQALRQARTVASADLFARLVRIRIADVMALAGRLRTDGQPDLALEAYRFAAAGRPDDFDVCHELLIHQLQLGLLGEALADLHHAPAFNDPEAAATFLRYRHLCEWMLGALAEVEDRGRRLSANAGRKPRLIYALAMWGEDYVTLCARHLRSLAAPGNIPALAERFDLHLSLATTKRDYEALRTTGVLDLFGGRFPVEPVFMPGELVRRDEHLKPSPVMYFIYSMGIHLGIHLARTLGAAVSPLTVDTVFADGAFGRLGELAAQGAEAICTTCPVCDRETFLPALDARFPQWDAAIHLSPRELMRMVHPHLHIIVRSALVSPFNSDFSCPPGVLFWRSGTDLVAHGFHVHPMYVSADRLARYDQYRFMSIDGHLCANLFPEPADWSHIHVITDADEFALVSLTSNRQEAGTTGRPFSLEQARRYKRDRSMIVDYNTWMFRHPIRFHGVFPAGTPDEYDPALVDAILAPDDGPVPEGDGR